MKVYTKHEEFSYDFPDQMAIILDYLQAHGEIHVSGSTIEDLYREFSNDRYDAGWMSIGEELAEEDLELLSAFADWLDNINY